MPRRSLGQLVGNRPISASFAVTLIMVPCGDFMAFALHHARRQRLDAHVVEKASRAVTCLEQRKRLIYHIKHCYYCYHYPYQ